MSLRPTAARAILSHGDGGCHGSLQEKLGGLTGMPLPGAAGRDGSAGSAVGGSAASHPT